MKASPQIVCFMAALFALGASETAPPLSIDLFESGQQGVHTYRIPALLQTIRGTLIAVVDARKDSSADLPGEIWLVERRSFDNGKTWEPQQILYKPSEGGAGDASLLFDAKRNRVWCFFAYGPPGIGFRTSKAGALSGPTTLQIHAIHSEDEGKTWSSPIDLTPQIKQPSWAAAFVTSGAQIVTKGGRFVLPLVVRDTDGKVAARDAYSDDGGATWHTGNPLPAGTDESHLVELSDDSLLQNFRDSHTRLLGVSRDGGITFQNLHHDPALIDPVCNAGFARLPGRKDILIFTNPASLTRERMTAKVSFDGGQHWAAERTIFAGPSAYSSTIALHDGSIAVLYERGDKSPVEKVTFTRFSVEWVQHGNQATTKGN